MEIIVDISGVNLEREDREITELVVKRTQAAGFHLGRMLIRGTPVDKGFARANWETQEGGLRDPSPVEDFGGPENAGPVAIRRMAETLMLMRNIAPIHFVNGVPYIRRLEDGWSKQAPGGWIRASVAATRAWLASGRVR